MKRINPKTGLEFKFGDTREDGYIFCHYRTTRPLKNNGYYAEQSSSKFVFSNKKQYNKQYSSDRYDSLEGRAKTLIDSARKRGKITINVAWVMSRLEKGVCELSGLPFDMNKPIKKGNYNPFSPSLDRIDSKIKEYSPENTRLVLTSVNLALNQYGLNHFLKLAKAIINKQKEK